MIKLLIPLDYLTEACFLSVNTNEKKYKMCLKLAQDQLKVVLGPEFYDEISTQYGAQADTFTAANETLYENHIKDYLAWETYSQYMLFAQNDSTPTGIRKYTEEHSEILTDIQAHAHERNVSKKAEDYRNTMITFIKEAQANDSTAYPLFTGCHRQEMSWGISSVSAQSDALYMVNKAVNTNE